MKSFNFGSTKSVSLNILALEISPVDIFLAHFVKLETAHPYIANTEKDPKNWGAYRASGFDSEKMVAEYTWASQSDLDDNAVFQAALKRAKVATGRKVIILLDDQAVLIRKVNASMKHEAFSPKEKAAA